MKKQKICIIGGSLAGLVTAISLSKLNCDIDLITGNINTKYRSNNTIAISQNNFNFLSKLNISKSLINKVWPCSIMKLYAEVKNKKIPEILEMENKKNKKKIFYMIKNINLINLMLNKINKIKSINVIKNQNVSKISNAGFLKCIKIGRKNYKYNLAIICTGNNSELAKKNFKSGFIKNAYNETSITTIINHKFIKNNITRQIFLDNSILALLPLSNTETSVVWSVKNDSKEQRNKFLRDEIKFHANKFYHKIKFKNKIEYNDLNFLIRNKYYQERILLFGDALHVVHPFVGQGFNMVLRDLMQLEKVLDAKIKLGLDLGSADILSEFSNDTKPNNFAFSIGIDILKSSFSLKNKYLKEVRNNVIKYFGKNESVKNIFFNIADKGLRF